MNRNYWLLLSFGPVAALSAGCSSKFDTCEARRTCRAGDKAGAANAGSEDTSAGEAGVEEGGGKAGNAGEGGTNDLAPALFGACSVKLAFACLGHAGAQRLACDGKLWQAGPTCAAGELCDSSDGTCAPTVAECVSAEPGAVVCRNDTLLTCGPDLVTATEQKTCDGLCKRGVCQAPACGDEKVEKGEVCDDAVANASGACAKCKPASCGDGVVYAGHEQCDDGNKVSGDGCSTTCRAEPVALALGASLTCALSSTGLVKCWGYNGSGQLGLGDTLNRGDTANTVPSRLSAIDLGIGRKAISISARGGSACALLDRGEVKCWGNNFFGQLGKGDKDNRGDGPGEMGDALKPIPFGSGLKAIGVSAAVSHSCVVLDGGGVKCWGAWESGQLGQDSRTDALSPMDLPLIKLARPATAVSASNYLDAGKGGSFGGATCALLDNGTFQCWGYRIAVPHTATDDVDLSGGIGDFSGEMSKLSTLSFGSGRSARSIVCDTVSAAVLDDGSLRLWGRGNQLGLGSGQVGQTPEQLAALPAVQVDGRKVKSFAVGKGHACATFDDGALKCWGAAFEGQLGLGSTDYQGAAPGNIASVDLGGHAALQVATGDLHTCAILDNGKLKCWGYNANGQLGLGDTKTRGDTGGKLSADTTVDLEF